MEDWKTAIENYEVSNKGGVRKKLLKGGYNYIGCSINNMGYKYFQINRDGKRKNYLIHQLVAKLFIGERTERDIDHIDQNKLNNDVLNLRYVSHHTNMLNQSRVILELGELKGKERKKEYYKLYQEKNGQKIKDNKKEYHDKEKIVCLCGATVRSNKYDYERHLKSKKHIKSL